MDATPCAGMRILASRQLGRKLGISNSLIWLTSVHLIAGTRGRHDQCWRVEIVHAATVLQQGKPCIWIPNVRCHWLVATSERWTLLVVLLGQHSCIVVCSWPCDNDTFCATRLMNLVCFEWVYLHNVQEIRSVEAIVDGSLDLVGRTCRASEDQSSRRINVGAMGEQVATVRRIEAVTPMGVGRTWRRSLR